MVLQDHDAAKDTALSYCNINRVSILQQSLIYASEGYGATLRCDCLGQASCVEERRVGYVRRARWNSIDVNVFEH